MNKVITDIVTNHIKNIMNIFTSGESGCDQTIEILNNVKDNIDKIEDNELYEYIEKEIIHIEKLKRDFVSYL